MIRLQIYFNVADSDSAAFEKMYHTIYLPALHRQEGFIDAHLLRSHTAEVHDEGDNYQLELDFNSEDDRRRWAASAEHDRVWSAAAALAKATHSQGYDIVESDCK